MPAFYQRMGFATANDFDPAHTFETSWLLSPYALFALRAVVALYAFVVIFVAFGWQDTHHEAYISRQSFSYFTDITYWGIAFYEVFAAIHTFTYARTGHALLNRWPRPLQLLHSLFYTTIVTYPFLVTIVFWIILYNPPWYLLVFDGWNNISKHGLNSLFALCEIVLPTTEPLPWLHLAFLILILSLYLALAYLTHATEGIYVYDFLNTNTGGKVAGYVFGILAGIIVIFVVVRYAIWVRRRYTGLAKRSRQDSSRTETCDDVEMDHHRGK